MGLIVQEDAQDKHLSMTKNGEPLLEVVFREEFEKFDGTKC